VKESPMAIQFVKPEFQVDEIFQEIVDIKYEFMSEKFAIYLVENETSLREIKQIKFV
jgi:hypothetical protein